MNARREAVEHWARAIRTLQTANRIRDDFDSVANRCYYAAFHAVSAAFSLNGKTFQSHAGVHSAVHRDFVNTGKWTKALGAGYSFLLNTRKKADYGGGLRVMEDEAARALDAARLIMKAIHEMHPDVFPFDGRDDDQNEQNR